MNFNYNCYPVIITSTEKTIDLNSICNSLLDNFEIPLKIISDKNDIIFESISEITKKDNIEYVIVTIKYISNYE